MTETERVSEIARMSFDIEKRGVIALDAHRAPNDGIMMNCIPGREDIERQNADSDTRSQTQAYAHIHALPDRDT